MGLRALRQAPPLDWFLPQILPIVANHSLVCDRLERVRARNRRHRKPWAGGDARWSLASKKQKPGPNATIVFAWWIRAGQKSGERRRLAESRVRAALKRSTNPRLGGVNPMGDVAPSRAAAALLQMVRTCGGAKGGR